MYIRSVLYTNTLLYLPESLFLLDPPFLLDSPCLLDSPFSMVSNNSGSSSLSPPPTDFPDFLLEGPRLLVGDSGADDDAEEFFLPLLNHEDGGFDSLELFVAFGDSPSDDDVEALLLLLDHVRRGGVSCEALDDGRAAHSGKVFESAEGETGDVPVAYSSLVPSPAALQLAQASPGCETQLLQRTLWFQQQECLR